MQSPVTPGDSLTGCLGRERRARTWKDSRKLLARRDRRLHGPLCLELTAKARRSMLTVHCRHDHKYIENRGFIVLSKRSRYTAKMDFSDVSSDEVISTTQLEDEIECCDVADEQLIMASNNFACNVTASVSTSFTLIETCVV